MPNHWQYRNSQLANAVANKATNLQTDFAPDFLASAHGSPLLAGLLKSRGLDTPALAQAFLNLQAYQPTSGLELPDMQVALDRLVQAIRNQEPILIYGDFDVDGITGTSILYETLSQYCQATVSYYIPDRATEGHGLNSAALIRLTSSRQVKLVLTTDTGITNFAEVSLLNGLGVDTIITDHHALPENLPPAVANVNSQRLPAEHPLHPLCGAGVAYKLSELLLEALIEDKAKAKQWADRLLDIVAVGTVVDMVPLLAENRYLVYRGLQVLNQRKRLGFNQILSQAGLNTEAPITSETLGFTIGPRLNALGRLERAEPGVELLTTDDSEKARTIAAHLEFLNDQRRQLCDKTFIEADSHFQQAGGLADNRAIILASPDWNPGIIGIVASRLIEKYHVPVFMMVLDTEKEILRCSARSIPGFNLHDELLTLQHYFIHFGGHAGAGGFAIKLAHQKAFQAALHQHCKNRVTDAMMQPIIEVDATLSWPQLNPALIDLIDRMAPFGMANPSPKFVLDNMTIEAQRFMGDDNRHTKLILSPKKDEGLKNSGQSKPIDGIIWNFGAGNHVDLSDTYRFVVVPSLNTYKGTKKIQLLIEDYQSTEKQPLISQLQTQLPEKTPEPVSIASADAAFNQLSQPRPGGANTQFVSSLATGHVKTHKTAEQKTNQKTIQNTGNAASTTMWIDQRNRTDSGMFVSQLIANLQGKKRIRVFHEGRPPQIPLLDPDLLITRNHLLETHDKASVNEPVAEGDQAFSALSPDASDVNPALGQSIEELILWDLPPSAAALTQLLAETKPQVIHLMGGKYQAVPLQVPGQALLKLIVQQLRQSTPQENGFITMSVPQMASRLATTAAVIRQGIAVLEKIQLLEAQLLETRTLPEAAKNEIQKQPVPERLQIKLDLSAGSSDTDIGRHLAFSGLRELLTEVGQYRQWLLMSDFDTIQQSVQLALQFAQVTQGQLGQNSSVKAVQQTAAAAGNASITGVASY
ncbi:MAG: single-stranded-DNA-specific exonuclease RecJ [Cyanobacteria bacterium P01_H01_bin.74]